jgi:uncharacterized coiled-coil protein SlyX
MTPANVLLTFLVAMMVATSKPVDPFGNTIHQIQQLDLQSATDIANGPFTEAAFQAMAQNFLTVVKILKDFPVEHIRLKLRVLSSGLRDHPDFRMSQDIALGKSAARSLQGGFATNIALNNAVASLQTQIAGNATALQAQIAGNITAIQNAIAGHVTSFSDALQASSNSVTALENQLAGHVTSFSDALQASSNSVTALENQLAGHVTSFSDALQASSNSVTALENQLAGHVTSFSDALQASSNSVTALENQLSGHVATLTTAIQASSSNSVAIEGYIVSNITLLEGLINGKVAEEATWRIGNDSAIQASLNSNLNQEQSWRLANESVIQDYIINNDTYINASIADLRTESNDRLNTLEISSAEQETAITDLTAGQSAINATLAAQNTQLGQLEADLANTTGWAQHNDFDIWVAQTDIITLMTFNQLLHTADEQLKDRVDLLEQSSGSNDISSLETRVESLESSHDAAIGALNEDVVDLKDADVAIHADIVAANLLITNLQTNTASKSEVDGLEVRVGDLEDSQTDQNTLIGDLEGSQTTQNTLISGLRTDVDNLEGSLQIVSNLNDAVFLQSNATSLVNRIEALEQSVGSGGSGPDPEVYASRLDAVEIKSVELEDRIGLLNADVVGLQDADVAIHADIVAANLLITNLQTNTASKSEVDGLEVRVGDLEDSQTDQNTLIGDLEGSQTTQNTLISGLRTDVDNLEGSLQTATDRITALEDDQSGSSNPDLVALQTQVDELATALDDAQIAAQTDRDHYDGILQHHTDWLGTHEGHVLAFYDRFYYQDLQITALQQQDLIHSSAIADLATQINTGSGGRRLVAAPSSASAFSPHYKFHSARASLGSGIVDPDHSDQLLIVVSHAEAGFAHAPVVQVSLSNDNPSTQLPSYALTIKSVNAESTSVAISSSSGPIDSTAPISVNVLAYGA